MSDGLVMGVKAAATPQRQKTRQSDTGTQETRIPDRWAEYFFKSNVTGSAAPSGDA